METEERGCNARVIPAPARVKQLRAWKGVDLLARDSKRGAGQLQPPAQLLPAGCRNMKGWRFRGCGPQPAMCPLQKAAAAMFVQSSWHQSRAHAFNVSHGSNFANRINHVHIHSMCHMEAWKRIARHRARGCTRLHTVGHCDVLTARARSPTLLLEQSVILNSIIRAQASVPIAWLGTVGASLHASIP